jgi:type I restriction enzyme S subunit
MNNNWRTKKLGDLFKIGSSKRVLKSQWKTEGVPFYRGREITHYLFLKNFIQITQKNMAYLMLEI